ncbi:hypothetical protein DMN91_002122, partial [Ooceraea biroi]
MRRDAPWIVQGVSPTVSNHFPAGKYISRTICNVH